MRKSTLAKFEEYYQYGTDRQKTEKEFLELRNFISRNWKNYQPWSNEKAKLESICEK